MATGLSLILRVRLKKCAWVMINGLEGSIITHIHPTDVHINS